MFIFPANHFSLDPDLGWRELSVGYSDQPRDKWLNITDKRQEEWNLILGLGGVLVIPANL